MLLLLVVVMAVAAAVAGDADLWRYFLRCAQSARALGAVVASKSGCRANARTHLSKHTHKTCAYPAAEQLEQEYPLTEKNEQTQKTRTQKTV